MSTSSDEAVLRDGRAVQLRAMRPSDEQELLQAFDRMSEVARYMRFMRVVREPDRLRLQAALASLPESGVALVATVPAADGYDIAGSAIALIGGGPGVCEFAINVDAAYGGLGLGHLLMTRLMDAARQRGLRTMEGFVLKQNASMLGLARRLGFEIDADAEDPSVLVCRKALA
ncbi:GNAT family N-acetyltransferase [Roseateles violae]|uniref:GNAT family N-acetyltransferase n=1 Tax=Roseateles violae TaxID=3058042 RepID=A0ABT8DQP8_9BURK|nr:GNAT family N-acetyltransferase [Pelomonas sp. PFR6]MDN3919264.1 GNAT family N-acetyltransferase [Pelomonas sp. PFR6]